MSEAEYHNYFEYVASWKIFGSGKGVGRDITRTYEMNFSKNNLVCIILCEGYRDLIFFQNNSSFVQAGSANKIENYIMLVSHIVQKKLGAAKTLVNDNQISSCREII